MTDYTWHIPDPDTQPEFYQDVPLKRLLAWVADTLLVVAISIVIVPFTAFTGLFFFPFLMMVVGFIYRTATLARGSATLGMRLAGMEIRTGSGQMLDLPMAMLHTAGYYISMAFVLPQVISVILMLTTPRAQGLTDHMIGTVALNRRANP